MGTFSLSLDAAKTAKLKETFKEDIKPNKNEYIDTFIQRDGLTISIYNSGKVVFQGDDAFYYAQAYLENKRHAQAGSDEVGTGDCFGPVVVCAAIVEEKDYPFIDEKHITMMPTSMIWARSCGSVLLIHCSFSIMLPITGSMRKIISMRSRPRCTTRPI